MVSSVSPGLQVWILRRDTRVEATMDRGLTPVTLSFPFPLVLRWAILFSKSCFRLNTSSGGGGIVSPFRSFVSPFWDCNCRHTILEVIIEVGIVQFNHKRMWFTSSGEIWEAGNEDSEGQMKIRSVLGIAK